MESIENRIRKLLSLSSSSNQHEAELAMLKAQELMRLHDIDSSVVETKEGRVGVEVTRSAVDNGKRRVPNWQKRLAVVVAENFRCKVYSGPGQGLGRSIFMYGARQDVAAAKPVLEFALRSAENCWGRYLAQRRRTEPSWTRQETELIKNDYFSAFISGVRQAFRKQVQAKGIVLSLHPDVLKYEKSLRLRTVNQRRKGGLGDSHARTAGFADGSKVRGGNKLTNTQRLIEG